MAFTIYFNDQLFSGTNTFYKTIAGESGAFLHDKVTLRYWIFYIKKITGPPETYNLCETHHDNLGADTLLILATPPDEEHPEGTPEIPAKIWSTATTLATGIENCVLDSLQEHLTYMLIVSYVKKVGSDYKFYTATSTPAQNLGVTWTHTQHHTIT